MPNSWAPSLDLTPGPLLTRPAQEQKHVTADCRFWKANINMTQRLSGGTQWKKKSFLV